MHGVSNVLNCVVHSLSVYMNAVKDHVITNVAGGKSICLTKTNFPDTGKVNVAMQFLVTPKGVE